MQSDPYWLHNSLMYTYTVRKNKSIGNGSVDNDSSNVSYQIDRVHVGPFRLSHLPFCMGPASVG